MFNKKSSDAKGCKHSSKRLTVTLSSLFTTLTVLSMSHFSSSLVHQSRHTPNVRRSTVMKMSHNNMMMRRRKMGHSTSTRTYTYPTSLTAKSPSRAVATSINFERRNRSHHQTCFISSSPFQKKSFMLSSSSQLNFFSSDAYTHASSLLSSSSSSSSSSNLRYFQRNHQRNSFKHHFCTNENMVEKNDDGAKEENMILMVPISKIQEKLLSDSTCCDDNNNNNNNGDNNDGGKNGNITNTNQSIYKTLQNSIRTLEEYDAPEPTSSACHLLSFALKDDFQWEDNGFSTLYSLLENGKNHMELRNKIITDEELNSFAFMLQRRITNEPIQYIIGQWDFHDITIKVRQPCLCPRPETEELVEYVARDIRDILLRRKANERTNGEKVRVLDVGCGTGAISIALANMFSSKDVEFVSIDVAKEAIELSRENACLVLGDVNNNNNNDDGDDGGENDGQKSNPYYTSLLCSAADFTNTHKRNLLNIDDDAIHNENQHTFGFDVVVSNPPYIPKQDMKTLSEDVVGYEDYGALCGGDDGMDIIRDIVQRLPEWCNREEGGDAICWMEVDTSHPQLMSEWLTPNDANKTRNNGVEFMEGVKDFYGLERFVKLRIKNKNV